MDSTTHPAWTLPDQQALRELRSDAVTLLADQLRPCLAQVWTAFGADPQQAARADAALHLNELEAALTGGNPRTWLDYVNWLQQVLVHRGAEADLLAGTLTKLASLYTERLFEPTRGRVAATLRATIQLLRSAEDGSFHYGGFGPRPWKECDAFRQALLAGDHSLSSSMFDEVLANSGDQVSTAVHMIQPALYDIGRRWQRNTVTVTQERLASAIVEALLAQSSGLLRSTPTRGQRVVLARAPTNHHALGLRIVADAFEIAGWETHLLPIPASAETLLPVLRDKQPQLLGLSASLSSHLLTMRELLRQLRQALGEGMPRVIVGGLAVNQYPDIARTMGVIVTGPDAENMIATLPDLEKAA